MLREYHKWYSPAVDRDMELLLFGHAGARVIVFPTQDRRFHDWEDYGMHHALSEHLENGWIQLYCVDGVDWEVWTNRGINATERAQRHFQYQDHVMNEVIPFSQSRNDNPFVMSVGASMGAYHALSIAMRFPHSFNRVIAMSGVCDILPWADWYIDDAIRECSPVHLLESLDEGERLKRLREIEWIIPIGNGDPLLEGNRWFSHLMWQRNVWHAFREWNGFAHDWPDWHNMIRCYIGGAD